MIPTPARMVLYTLSAHDADMVNQRRADATAHARSFPAGVTADPGKPRRTGHVAHVGNGVAEGDQYPAMVVRVWGTTADALVNLQVFLDGSDTLWATSVKPGEGPRTYAWPPRV